MKEYMESKFSILFRHWIKANPQISGTYEMKDSKGKDYINFSEVTEDQINYGLAINSNKGTFIRVQAINGGEPDYVYFRNSPAYIVINYPKTFSIISIGTFILEKERSKRKSLTEQRASEISVKTVKKTPTK
jgi:hypothetical protein